MHVVDLLEGWVVSRLAAARRRRIINEPSEGPGEKSRAWPG
jgi:hypothetical protein